MILVVYVVEDTTPGMAESVPVGKAFFTDSPEARTQSIALARELRQEQLNQIAESSPDPEIWNYNTEVYVMHHDTGRRTKDNSTMLWSSYDEESAADLAEVEIQEMQDWLADLG